MKNLSKACKKTLTVTLTLLMASILGSCGPKRVDDLKDVTVTPYEASNGRYQVIIKNTDNSYGVADKDGNIILEPKYSEIKAYVCDSISDDRFLVTDANKKKGVFNMAGKKVIPVQYDEVDFIDYGTIKGFYVIKHFVSNDKYEINNHTIVDDEQHSKWGFIDYKGKELVPCEFKSLNYEGDGYFIGRKYHDKKGNEFEGLYKDGKAVIPVEYHDLYVSNSKNGAVGIIRNKKGITDLDKYFVFDLDNDAKKTEFIWGKANVTDHYIRVTSVMNGKYTHSIYDFQGNTIIAPGNFQEIGEQDDVFICNEASRGSNSILTNRTLKTLFQEEGISLRFESGVIIAYNRITYKYGVINREGKWYIPCEYDKIRIEDGKIKAINFDRNREDAEYPFPD